MSQQTDDQQIRIKNKAGITETDGQWRIWRDANVIAPA